MTTDRPTPTTALEPVHVVLPMRTVSGGKARLGGALDAEEREELVLGMLLHTLSVLSAWSVCRRIHLVSPDPVLDVATQQAGVDVSVHRQQGEGLNDGISLGIAAANAEGAASVLVLPGDLPELTVAGLDELMMAADAGMAAAAGGPLVAIVPSDARSGTNALLLRPPGGHPADLRRWQLRGAPAGRRGGRSGGPGGGRQRARLRPRHARRPRATRPGSACAS